MIQLITEQNIDSVQETKNTHIVNDFENYFANFNTSKVLILTDEELESDLRVQNQILAFKRLTDDITLIRVNSTNFYSETQKKILKRKIYINFLKNIFLFPKFMYIVKKMIPTLSLRQKARQGIFNDNSYLLFDKIETKGYSLVLCNNLMCAMAIKLSKEIDYIYDSHELEIFRNRKKQSIERSFYVYLQERQIFQKIKNIITISKCNAETLSKIHHININDIQLVYNQNFEKNIISLNKYYQNIPLFVYIGRVEKNRGLDDIITLTRNHKVLIIACNYEKEDLDYIIHNSKKENLILFMGMNYQEFLLSQLILYSQVYFLILITKSSLSYKNALPNKFFQAHALGLPVIVYEDTYLANVIKTYKCGLVLNENMLDKLPMLTMNQYQSMRVAMIEDISIAISNQKL